MSPTIKFDRASKALELLLAGKSVKQTAYEVGLSPASMSVLKGMFPLFLGLPRKYGAEEPQD